MKKEICIIVNEQGVPVFAKLTFLSRPEYFSYSFSYQIHTNVMLNRIWRSALNNKVLLHSIFKFLNQHIFKLT